MSRGVWILEWYRYGISRLVLRQLAFGACLLCAGCFLSGVGVVLSFRGPETTGAVLTTLGTMLTLSGPLYSVLGLRELIRQDQVIALRTDGLWVQDRASESLTPWEDIAQANYDPVERTVSVTLRSGQRLLLAAPAEQHLAQQFANRIWFIRNRALFGLL